MNGNNGTLNNMWPMGHGWPITCNQFFMALVWKKTKNNPHNVTVSCVVDVHGLWINDIPLKISICVTGTHAVVAVEWTARRPSTTPPLMIKSTNE